MRKLNDNQREQIIYAMECVRLVKNEIEETGKDKRIVNALDKVIGILDNISWK